MENQKFNLHTHTARCGHADRYDAFSPITLSETMVKI